MARNPKPSEIRERLKSGPLFELVNMYLGCYSEIFGDEPLKPIHFWDMSTFVGDRLSDDDKTSLWHAIRPIG